MIRFVVNSLGMLLPGIGSLALLAGCGAVAPVENAPLRDKPVYINLALIQSHHPGWGQLAQNEAFSATIRSSKGAAQKGRGAPSHAFASRLPDEKRSGDTPEIDRSGFAAQVANIHAGQKESTYELRQHLEAVNKKKLEARRQLLNNTHAAELSDEWERLDEEFLQKAASIPGRYAHQVAQIDLQLASEKVNPARREELLKERARLQDEWQSDLSNLGRQKEASLQDAEKRFKERIAREVEATAAALQADLLARLHEQNVHIDADLGRDSTPEAESRWEIKPLPQVPGVEQSTTPARAPVSTKLLRFRKHAVVAAEPPKDRIGLAKYIAEDTRRLVNAIAREHRWKVQAHPAKDMPDCTRQTLREITKRYWSTTAYRKMKAPTGDTQGRR